MKTRRYIFGFLGLMWVLGVLVACDRQDNQWGAFDASRKVLSVVTDTLSLVEGGAEVSLRVSLPMVPSDTVWVVFTVADSQAVVSPDTVIFVPLDDSWAVPQFVAVQAVDDVIDEGPQGAALSVVVTSRDAGYDGQGGIDLVPLLIADNDHAGVFVSDAALTVMESPAGQLTARYRVRLLSQPVAAVTIRLSETPAEPSFHIMPDSLVFTPANWDTAQAVSVWAELDQINGDNMDLVVHHAATSADSNYTAALTIPSVDVSVLDNTLVPAASLTLVVPGQDSMTELDTSAGIALRVSLNHASVVPVTVHLATTDGTAVGGADYQIIAQDVVFAPGDSLSQDFILEPVDDQIVEHTESLQVGISAVSNVVIGGQNRLDLTIFDDDQVTVRVTGITLNEDAGGAAFTVSLPFAVPLPVEFTLVTVDGSAAAGTDYVSVAASFVITPGDTQRVVPITVMTDLAHEGDEDLIASLSALSDNTSWDGVPGRIVLVDDDPQTVTLSEVVVTEGVANAVFVLDMAASYNVPLVLTLNTINGDGLGSVSGQEDAAAGADFNIVTNVDWTVPAGVRRDSFQVAITRDSAGEATREFFRLQVAAASEPSFAGLVAMCTILDEDQPQIAVTDTVAAETDANAYFTVTVVDTGGNPVLSAADISVTYATVDQTATGGADYVTSTGTLVIAAGSSGGQIVVPLLDDNHDDDNETFVLNLTAPVNATIRDTGAAPYCSLVDNEFPSINLAQTIAAENEGSTHQFTVSLTTLRQDATAFNLVLDPGNSGGVGVDYDFGSAGYRVIPPFTSALTFAVPFLDDQLAGESDEVLQAQVSFADVALGVIALDMTIIDAPAVNIAPDAATEGTDLVFTATLTAPSTADVVFNVQYSSGTANVLQDIDGSNTGPFTIPAGMTTIDVITPTIAGDGGDFAVEDFVVTMINPVNATLGAFNSAVGTIYDGDPPALDIAGDATASEGTDVVFTVNLSWASGAPVDFYVAFTDGTAAGANIDFNDFGTGPHTVPAGALSTTVAVSTIALDGPELATENFTMTIWNPTNGVLGLATTATGNIQDGDQPALTVAAGDTAIEGGSLAFRIHLGQPTIVPVSFDLVFGDGSTQGPLDYTPSSTGPFSMMPGTVDTLIMVATVDDTLFENVEQFVVQLGNGLTNAVVGVPAQANGVIIDND